MSVAVKDVVADSREKRTAPSSLSEFVEQYETAIKERQDLSTRLFQALEEIETINQIYEQRRLEFDSERTRLNLEIDSLRTQLHESAKKQAEKQSSNGDSAGVQSVIAARERLIRDEFDKKFQELLVEVRTQKKKYIEQVDQMKKKMARCMCQASRPY